MIDNMTIELAEFEPCEPHRFLGETYIRGVPFHVDFVEVKRKRGGKHAAVNRQLQSLVDRIQASDPEVTMRLVRVDKKDYLVSITPYGE